MADKITLEQMKSMFENLIDPVILDIDKEMEDLKIPDDKDLFNF